MLVGFPIFGAGIVVIPLIATLIYTHVYNKRANKIINSDFSKGIVSKKPMMSPIKFFLIWLLSMIAIFIAIILISFVAYKSNVDFNTVSTDQFKFEAFDNDQIENSILKGTSPDKAIRGYQRFEKKTDKYIFTYYISENFYETFPEYIINIKSVDKSKKALTVDLELSNESNIVPTASMSGYKISDGIWLTIYRGDTFDQDLKLNCYLSDEEYKDGEDNGENVHDNRPNDKRPSGTLTITNKETEKVRGLLDEDQY